MAFCHPGRFLGLGSREDTNRRHSRVRGWRRHLGPAVDCDVVMDGVEHLDDRHVIDRHEVLFQQFVELDVTRLAARAFPDIAEQLIDAQVPAGTNFQALAW